MSLEFVEDDEPVYPPFTGTEYIAAYETIDDHPYAVAFGQFLGNGIHPDTANELAFGLHNAIAQISDDPFDPLRMRAVDIFDRLNEMNYWEFSSAEDGDREPENFLFAY
ncbi:MAG: hypothetical protein KME38_24005 [Spirirestis rafaelensis WJT71-NPBG6]|jgi:hypothetical protein|nr:hypothetical protein [Spirirestis rafaelensis WJT71-NPBG6]